MANVVRTHPQGAVVGGSRSHGKPDGNLLPEPPCKHGISYRICFYLYFSTVCDILFLMTKTTLVAGKDMPACSKFADGLSQMERRVVVCEPPSLDDMTDDAETDAASQAVNNRQQKIMGKAAGVATVPWNKPSPISARTLLLSAEAFFEGLDEVVLYFDEELFASRANQVNIEECAQGCDEMILSYQYLTLEVLNRFQRRHDNANPGVLVFLLKEGPSAADAMRMPSLRNGAYSIASPVVAAAATAFMAFAENIVAIHGDLPNIRILLVRGDKNMDIVSNDAAFAKWLASYIDALEETKTKTDARKSLSWIKPGSKVQSGGFSLFGRR